MKRRGKRPYSSKRISAIIGKILIREGLGK
jgi:hypothetical protein